MASLSEFLSDPASAATWTVVPDQSTIVVKAKSMWGVVPVKGRFTEFSGDGKSPPPKRFPASSTSRPHRCAPVSRSATTHLHSADFFEAEKFPDISVVVTGRDAIDGRHHQSACTTDHQGHDETGGRCKTKVTPVGDGSMRLTTQATVNRQDFGVDGNMMGMIGDNATISGDVVFRRRDLAAWRVCSIGACPNHLGRCESSSTATIRGLANRSGSALGKRVHPDLPELTYLEVATGPMVIEQMDEGGFDLVILDGEATPVGGMGIAKQLKDEIDDCPPILVLTGRADDAWLANWSRAEAAVPHPIDPIRLGEAVASLLRAPVQ